MASRSTVVSVGTVLVRIFLGQYAIIYCSALLLCVVLRSRYWYEQKYEQFSGEKAVALQVMRKTRTVNSKSQCDNARLVRDACGRKGDRAHHCVFIHSRKGARQGKIHVVFLTEALSGASPSNAWRNPSHLWCQFSIQQMPGASTTR